MEIQNIFLKVNDFFKTLPELTISGIIEIALIAIFFYVLFTWVRSSKTWNLLRGIFAIFLFVCLCYICNFQVILYLLSKVSGITLVVLIIIFQNDIRIAIEKIGKRNYIKNFFENNKNINNIKISNEISKAVFSMAKVKTGALIVIENLDNLQNVIDTGILINGDVSSQLLINIFEKNTPLHDGAVIIRNDKIISATCYLPLSDNNDISKELGTRHRAAIGISEISDCVVVVVSEETGKVKFIFNTQMIEMDNINTLNEKLLEFIYKEDKIFSFSHFFNNKKKG